MQRLQPPAGRPKFTGSMVLRWMPTLLYYYATWYAGSNQFSCYFYYTPATGAAHAWVLPDLASDTDWGYFQHLDAGLLPLIHYDSAIYASLFYGWSSKILITS